MGRVKENLERVELATKQIGLMSTGEVLTSSMLVAFHFSDLFFKSLYIPLPFSTTVHFFLASNALISLGVKISASWNWMNVQP